jgi:hypothetical protein
MAFFVSGRAARINNRVAFDTVKEARKNGYTRIHHRALQAGYCSRVANVDSGEVYQARDKRLVFYFAPNGKSTLYCYRVYLMKGEEDNV